MATKGTTRLDSDVTKPSVTAPGDGPADTTDPTEHASSATPALGAEAIAAGTVNAVVKVPEPDAPAAGTQREETYQATRPNGEVVTVKRNIETGETEIVDDEG